MPNAAAALIAAVGARDTDAAEKLLAAGAPPDARDETGYTDLGLAAVQADSKMCELLLRTGADVDLRCPGGRTPMMLAADGGAIGAWNHLCAGSPDFLLRDDLGQDAMDIAPAWLGIDPAAELLSWLDAADGEDAEVTRGPAPDEGIGSLEAVRVTTRTATASVQMGHVAILTDLEERDGIRVPYDELADRAVAFDPDHACYFYAAFVLGKRLDEETLTLAARELEGVNDHGIPRAEVHVNPQASVVVGAPSSPVVSACCHDAHRDALASC